MAEIKIIVKINFDTETIQYEVEGVPGSSCTDITEIFTRGLDVKESEFTKEYLQAELLPVYSGD